MFLFIVWMLGILFNIDLLFHNAILEIVLQTLLFIAVTKEVFQLNDYVLAFLAAPIFPLLKPNKE